MEKSITLGEIFLTFLKTGIILLGGGYVILPILQSEIVEKRNWLTLDELYDYYAVSQSLPGLIAINISIFAGYRISGKFGALAAVCGLTFSAFWAIIAISAILSKIVSNSLVQGVFWGVGIAVIVLIFSAVREMWSKSVNDKTSLLIYLIALCTMLIIEISPVYIIIISAIVGIICKSVRKKQGKK
ncbi:MAG: chromate transporter [Candidatus Gastranaerophilales bacterium]|nr:chromate transporter [Candidatus Gastranaerophilales bacterium]